MGLQVTHARGEDRFYSPARARRAHQNQKAAEQLRLAQCNVTPSQSLVVKGSSNLNREPENQAGSIEHHPKPVAVPTGEPVRLQVERDREREREPYPKYYRSEKGREDIFGKVFLVDVVVVL